MLKDGTLDGTVDMMSTRIMVRMDRSVWTLRAQPPSDIPLSKDVLLWPFKAIHAHIRVIFVTSVASEKCPQWVASFAIN